MVLLIFSNTFAFYAYVYASNMFYHLFIMNNVVIAIIIIVVIIIIDVIIIDIIIIKVGW
jgi:hypothetical protein